MYFYDSEMGQGLLSHQMKKVCGVYVDSWKNFKYPYFLVVPQSTEAHSSFCVLPADNLSLSSPLVLSWPNVGINSKKVERDHFFQDLNQYSFPAEALTLK